MDFDECLQRVWHDLLYKHRQAALQNDEETRKRLFKLIDELEAVYPQLNDWYV